MVKRLSITCSAVINLRVCVWWLSFARPLIVPGVICRQMYALRTYFYFIFIYVYILFFSPWSFQIAKSTKCISKIRVKQWNTTCSAVIGLCPSDICSILQAQSSDFGGYTLLIPLLMSSVIFIFFSGRWRSTNKSLEIMIFLFHNSMIWIFKDLPTITLLQSKTINVFLLWDICKADHCMGYFLFNKTHQNNIQIVHRLDNWQSLLLGKFNPMS